jgi:hypothetical protein
MLHIWDVFAFGMFEKTIFGDKPKSKTPKEKVNQPQKHNLQEVKRLVRRINTHMCTCI